MTNQAETESLLPALGEEEANDFELRLLATMSQANALWDEIKEELLLIPVNKQLLRIMVCSQAEYGSVKPETIQLYMVDIAGKSPVVSELVRRLLSQTVAFPESLWGHYVKLAIAQPRLRRAAGLERKIRVQAGFPEEVSLIDDL